MADVARLERAGVIDHVVEDVTTRYTLGQQLGEGRFSRVFSAVNKSSGAEVALKAIDRSTLEDDEAADALIKEVRALRRAYAAEGGGHVVKLHEVLLTPGVIYLVLERVLGRELFDVVESGPLASTVARRVITQLLTALKSLHGCGIVHCDVKPENLIVSRPDDANHVSGGIPTPRPSLRPSLT